MTGAVPYTFYPGDRDETGHIRLIAERQAGQSFGRRAPDHDLGLFDGEGLVRARARAAHEARTGNNAAAFLVLVLILAVCAGIGAL